MDLGSKFSWDGLKSTVQVERFLVAANTIAFVSSTRSSGSSFCTEVRSERLLLRKLSVSDVDPMAEIFAAPEVWYFPFGRSFTHDETLIFLEDQVDHWERHSFGLWGAYLLSDQSLIGYLGLSIPSFAPELLPAVEVGWRIHPRYWGQGLATEGARLAITEARDSLGLDHVISVTQVQNAASSRVCHRIGMLKNRQIVLPATDRRSEVTAWVYRKNLD